jgi:metallophosphoesterase (TIGR00282 family)
MKILFCGDVVGKSGREALKAYLPRIQKKHAPELIIVNGENAAHGFGLNEKICYEFYSYGVHVITTGNHVWDQKDFVHTLNQDISVIRPLNYPHDAPGRGYIVYKLKDGRKVLVINVMGNLFMEELNMAFPAVEAVISHYELKKNVDVIVVDVHAEATSEKNAMGYFLDGRVSAVLGTHTHIPTSDTRILPKGTGYQTDLGMCGDYDSIVGFKSETPVARFLKKGPTERLSPAEKAGTLSGVLFTLSDQTGLCEEIIPIVLGPHLINRL